MSFRHHARLSLAAISGFAIASSAASAQGSLAARTLIRGPIQEDVRTVLAGNVRSAAADPANDRGEANATLPLEHMILQLKRSPQQEAALDAYIATLNDSTSSNYHHWLTAAQLGSEYGPAEADIAAVTGWLKSQGFSVNSVAATGMTIDFSGTAGQVKSAFRTSMHRLSVDGANHLANTSDPSIPSAIAGVVEGIASLNDFRPHQLHHAIHPSHFDPRTGQQTTEGTAVSAAGAVHPDYTYTSSGSTYQAVVPGDLATIYNLNPLFSSGVSGQGQTIVVIEDTNVYSTADWTTFRKTFGLSSYTSGSFTQQHPGNCTNPGVNAADGEAILDAEWASAAAPSAAIVLASCADTSTTFGGLIALNNLINSSNPPKIVSISYGESESENGASANAAYASAYKNAVAEGISVFVSSGDEGAASSDANATKATHGIAVSGFASTPYNVAVGGTDFGDTYAGTNSSYWNSTNTSTFASAKSYIPEIPWNDSCASQLIASKSGYSTTYGTSGFCNSTTGKQYYLTTGSGSGGPSGCATGKASTTGVVSGTCKGTAKPSFQTGLLGVPSDGVRDIPDVSLFAANGVWGHYYVYCYTDTANGGTSCSGAPSTWSGAGGTSFASPIMAAMQALVNQKTGSAWGNPNPTYYNLARAEYGSTGNSNCNSTNGASGTSGCTFYDVKQGDIDVNCTGTHNCYRPSGTNGVLSTSTTSYQPAYGTTTGWDFATGIGTVNAYNLVVNWGTVSH
ncbi:S53 family peptidase [Terriglobus aquaticus]|uniref:Protease pro-enzyme activation domain-containing protein n=1 Tax=Terriglobus aquaticus TaxID=940139 RepID=A0ABW9KIZ6_9BACT|nr:protease pro-enzyme activation domain-containing protein [Terriglobus aquaticus]